MSLQSRQQHASHAREALHIRPLRSSRLTRLSQQASVPFRHHTRIPFRLFFRAIMCRLIFLQPESSQSTPGRSMRVEAVSTSHQ